ncbi:amidase [Streptomyces sp. NPDC051018]|uniref:amidase n=1 Tax=Streptomyces sp. NPDC051018 TaxID=3365639 RepID=UPI003789C94E
MAEKLARGIHESTNGDPLGSLTGCAQVIRTGAASPLDIVREALARIEAGDGALNSLVTVNDRAEAEAQTVTEEIRRGRLRGPLHGVPVVVKDVIDTAGLRTTTGSAAFTGHIPEEDAEVVRRLKEAGAVIVAKANTDTFAAHATGTMSFGGPVRNPADPSRITGGSSSGTAAALAAGFCVAGIGTDTGGSIRILRPVRSRRDEADVRSGQQPRPLPPGTDARPCGPDVPDRGGQRPRTERDRGP